MALLTGVLTVPIAGRIGSALQTPRAWWAVWMVPVGVSAGVAALVSAPVALGAALTGCLVLFAAALTPPANHEAYRRRGRLALQAALAVLVTIALPGFVAAVADIAG
jgi:glucose-6-phosphate-specific signal transduction histidine kinase